MSPVTKQAPAFFDSYTPFSYKTWTLADRWRQGLQWLAPTWVGEHRRRLQAYALLQGYRDNAARLFLEAFTQEEQKAQRGRREYGDAALLLETGRSKLLGDQQNIVVSLADQYDEKSDSNTTEAAAAAQRQDELRQWAEDDRFTSKMIETERNATTFGDGVYSLIWDSDKDRPVLLPWEPDAYFPVLDDVLQGGEPTKVHLAWELTDEQVRVKYDKPLTVVHRITYELVDVAEVDLAPYSVPWSDKPVTKVCIMTEAEFTALTDVRRPDDFDEASARFMQDADGNDIDRKPLGIDFIPVIHIPNTVAEIEHFGQSLIARVLQLIDDLHSVDSDLQASSDLTGNPLFVTKGAGDVQKSVGPGAHWDIPVDGDASFLSGKDGLESLAKHRDDLLDRLAHNSRITAAALGRINPEKLRAGVILQLSFGPLTSLVDEMRLARRDKYRNLNAQVQKYMLLNGVWQGDVLDAELTFGSYIPADVSTTMTDVVAAYQAKVISLETALRMLMEVGVPIEDISDEMTKIDERDYAGATALLDATGSDKAVEDKLGIKIDRPPVPATLQQFQQGQPPQNPPPNQPPNAPPGQQKPPQ